MIDGKFKEIKDLSSGSYGKVWKWSLANDASQQVAVKVYIKKQDDSDGEIRHFQSECEALTQLRHPYIVELVEYNDSGIRVDEVGNTSQVRYAALELAENGNLLDYVVDRTMDDKIVRYYFKQLLTSIEYMHANGICHRDLKLENILLDHDYNIKVSDFGFATSLEGSNSDNKLYDWKGTLRYMAPEIFKGSGYLGRSVDIFALGVILFSMKTGRPPFMRMAAIQDRLYYFIQSYQFEGYWMMWDHFALQTGFELPNDFKNLFIAMVCFYPNYRLSLHEIFQTEWMRGPIAGELEVKSYMKALQKTMELHQQEQFGKQENGQSNFIINMKNDEEFEVKEANNPIDDVNKIEDKDKGKLIHSDIENELDLDDDNEFDLGEDSDKLEDKEDVEFDAYMNTQLTELEKGHKDKSLHEYPPQQDTPEGDHEEIDTNICTVFPDKIWEYLMEYAQINNFEANFDTSDFTLNFIIPNGDQEKYFGMKFVFTGWESMEVSKSSKKAPQIRNSYRIYFLKDHELDEEEFKVMGLHFLDQISNYI